MLTLQMTGHKTALGMTRGFHLTELRSPSPSKRVGQGPIASFCLLERSKTFDADTLADSDTTWPWRDTLAWSCNPGWFGRPCEPVRDFSSRRPAPPKSDLSRLTFFGCCQEGGYLFLGATVTRACGRAGQPSEFSISELSKNTRLLATPRLPPSSSSLLPRFKELRSGTSPSINPPTPLAHHVRQNQVALWAVDPSNGVGARRLPNGHPRRPRHFS